MNRISLSRPPWTPSKQYSLRKSKRCAVLFRFNHLILNVFPTQGQPALVTFVTAGYPRQEDTVNILLALEKGGSDIIELGVPFSDPIADGPAIQESNTVCPYSRSKRLMRFINCSSDRPHSRCRLCNCSFHAERGQIKGSQSPCYSHGYGKTPRGPH
jgi:hypothetical protein